jgi:hypothetical protein
MVSTWSLVVEIYGDRTEDHLQCSPFLAWDQQPNSLLCLWNTKGRHREVSSSCPYLHGLYWTPCLYSADTWSQNVFLFCFFSFSPPISAFTEHHLQSQRDEDIHWNFAHDLIKNLVKCLNSWVIPITYVHPSEAFWSLLIGPSCRRDCFHATLVVSFKGFSI